VFAAIRVEVGGCTVEIFSRHSMPDNAVIASLPIEVASAFRNLDFANPVFLIAAHDGSDRPFVLER
jgi:hypothetical protein